MTEFKGTKVGSQEADRGKGVAVCRTRASVLSSRLHLGVGDRCASISEGLGENSASITVSGGEGLKIGGKGGRQQGV